MLVSTLLNSAGCLLATTFLVIYSIECFRRSTDRQPHRAKNGQPGGGVRIADPAATTGNLANTNHPNATAPDASTLPLLAIAKPAPRGPPAPDSSILSSTTSSGRPETDTTLEENTLITILSEEAGEEGNKTLVSWGKLAREGQQETRTVL